MIQVRIIGSYRVTQIANNEKSEFSDGGIYLWTLRHQKKISIVYIGETQCYYEKFTKYRREIPNLKHYFIIPDENDSVYSLLQETDYKKLFTQKKIWVPELPDNLPWIKEEASKYLDKLEIYLLPLEGELNTKNHRQTLESQIQTKLVNELAIPPYNSQKYRLGLIWKRNKDLYKIRFKLDTIPAEFDERTKEILKSI